MFINPLRAAGWPAHRDTEPAWRGGAPIERDARGFDEEFGCQPGDHDFVALRAAFRATGGIARGADLACTLAQRRRGDIASLARLIVGAEIFSFEWDDTFWVPMFQFVPGALAVKPGPRQVLAELSRVYDGWTLAVWFARPNSWLNGCRPVDRLDADLPTVLAAARADRFIATA